ncbi:MAG: hypothetical protein LBV43_02055 [Prevotella sp.]|jgi:hypothetical protein|nr:hypothetical protein [Prevotella sp.]
MKTKEEIYAEEMLDTLNRILLVVGIIASIALGLFVADFGGNYVWLGLLVFVIIASGSLFLARLVDVIIEISLSLKRINRKLEKQDEI